MVVPNLVETVAKKLQIPEAEIGRRLGVGRNRLYQWKTYKRRMPTKALYQLVTMAGDNLTATVGQYQLEWHAIKAQQGKAEFLVERG